MKFPTTKYSPREIPPPLLLSTTHEHVLALQFNCSTFVRVDLMTGVCLYNRVPDLRW